MMMERELDKADIPDDGWYSSIGLDDEPGPVDALDGELAFFGEDGAGGFASGTALGL